MLSVLISWSGGKDSTLALYLLNKQKYEVKTLFATISSEYNRVRMHGIRRDLLEKQANSIGIPLHIVSLPKNTTNEGYGKIMEKPPLPPPVEEKPGFLDTVKGILSRVRQPFTRRKDSSPGVPK